METSSIAVDWILEIRNNENAALRQLYSLYKSDCIAWLTSNANVQLEDAKEIFQISVVILYDNVVSGKLEQLNSNVKSYLIGICKNKAYELYRAQKKTSVTDQFPTIKSYIMEGVTEKEELEERIDAMTSALNALGDPCRLLLQLFYYKKKSMDEITGLMQYKNASTTKNLKYKCIKRLQVAMVPHKEING